MPIPPSPKRQDYKTRKEYRFAHKKHKREIQKQPIVIVTSIVFAIVLVATHGNGPATLIALIGTPICFQILKNKYT
jgi:hypothetical protein